MLCSMAGIRVGRGHPWRRVALAVAILTAASCSDDKADKAAEADQNDTSAQDGTGVTIGSESSSRSSTTSTTLLTSLEAPEAPNSVACSLLTADVVRERTGADTLEVATGDPAEGVDACSWRDTEGVVAMEIVYSEFAGDLITNVRSSGAQELDGPADATLFTSPPPMLAAQSGDAGFTLTIGGATLAAPQAGGSSADPAGDDVKAVLQALARDVIAQLP